MNSSPLSSKKTKNLPLGKSMPISLCMGLRRDGSLAQIPICRTYLVVRGTSTFRHLLIGVLLRLTLALLKIGSLLGTQVILLDFRGSQFPDSMSISGLQVNSTESQKMK